MSQVDQVWDSDVKQFKYKIHGMDCAEEVSLLKKEVGPVAGGEECVLCDLLRGEMTVRPAYDSIAAQDIEAAVARTGLKALAVSDDSEGGARAAELTRSQGEKLVRVVACGASGLFLVAGYIVETISSGSLLAAISGDGSAVSLPAVALFLASAVAGAWFVAPRAYFAARRLRPDMHLLMMVAVIGAIVLGEWLEAGSVTFLFALALLLESWSVGRARRAIQSLMELSPQRASVLSADGDGVIETLVNDVPLNALVRVKPGEKIPLDGVVTKGVTSVDQAPITGESSPAEKETGDEVYAGTINNEGTFEFRVTRAAGDTTLARIIKLVEEAQTRRAVAEKWVDKFARYYTPAMIATAVAVSLVPPLFLGGEWVRWFYQALVMLVIACPCALVISTPVSIVASLTAAAREGVLIKGGAFVEAPAKLKALALDKTGTLTRGHPEVQEVIPFNGHSPHDLLARAASLESLSEHPLASAILKKAKSEGVGFEPAEGYRAIQGKGAEALLNGKLFWIGSHRFMHERADEHPDYHRKAEELEAAGHSVVAIGNDDHVCGLISVADGLRQEAVTAVREIKASGISQVVMLTGDNEGTARAVATAAGVDDYKAELMPEDKLKTIESMVREHRQVAMVGDGVNDAPAMARSSLGIAMAAVGTDAAIETSDIALMSDDLMKLPWLIRHSRRTLRVIKQNIIFALALKATFMALALGGVATLWMAIAADMGASLLVIFNSLRLLTPHPDQ